MHKERPVISNLVAENISDSEKFQNEVLRPIIKMQNDLLLVFLIEYIKKRKINFADFSEEKKKLKIKSILEKDNNFKNQTLGIVIGDFSVEEYLLYAKKTSEYNKRIIQIITQRLQSKSSFINL